MPVPVSVPLSVPVSVLGSEPQSEPEPAPAWIDTHCHLDADEFAPDRDAVRARARAAGLACLVIPAVATRHLDAVRELAHRHGDVYALGLHPLYVADEPADALDRLAAALQASADDPQLVAVGEIGIDGFVPGLDLALQERFYAAQLDLAEAAGLPVILHVRRSADLLLKHLRRRPGLRGGIAHAFNGSEQQAQAFVDLGFRLGFGGALTFERALQIRRLATSLPAGSLVLETDAPDIPPHWLYRTAAERATGASSRNEPAELPRIAAELAGLRGLSTAELAALSTANARAALPRLAAWLDRDG
ncbi:TatD family hydrolase [Leptothrix discophora]|uniref:TatD family hydrolase n=1 Tax=Leptothrix discophora TaxID=89 RepID=A0ABT9G2R3_LEPDI|nr:TatD family hydrolase [Leptothrix discophora]MDP4300468.1 TatD family hydrolase [Leptothrix discophora]